jgi:hypothetical protein
MADPEHLKKLNEGLEPWNRSRATTPFVPDLNGADLRGAELNRANFSEAHLNGANLSRANLNGADLRGANLDGADLSRAHLKGANLDEADLNGANFSEAHLNGANLTRSRLTGADVKNVKLAYTVFIDVDLRGVKGLDSCMHNGPSYVDYTTLARSGRLPLEFLRGCGLPDPFIDYLPSLINEAIEFYSCFISYSTKDQDFADRLYADLQNRGVRCWFAPHDIQGGKKIHEQIDEAIRRYDKLLLILSESSMNSEWVKTEIANARQKEIEQKRQVLFPLSIVEYANVRSWKCFDADTGKDSAREIREYFIPDFSEWKNHDSYQKAFERLLKDLKSTS